MNQGLFRLIVFGAVAGIAIWVLAGIGLVTVATSIGSSAAEPTSRGEPLISRNDVMGLDVPDMPRHPATSRVGYRFDAFAEVTLTELEYATDASAPDVRDWYLVALDRNGWDIVSAGWRERQWTADVSKDDREATIRVGPSGGATGIEVRVIDAAVPRGDPPAR